MKKIILSVVIAIISSSVNASVVAELTGLGVACPDPERSKKFFPIVAQFVISGDAKKLDMINTSLQSEYGCFLLNGIGNTVKVDIHKTVKDGEFDFYQFTFKEANGKKVDIKDKFWVWDSKAEGFPLFKMI